MKKRRLFRFVVLSFFAMMVFAACKPTTHTITFDADNGSALTTQSAVNGAVLPEPAVDPVKEHFIFQYWYTTDPNVAYTFTNAVTSSFTLTAKYNPIVFNATFVLNNGSPNTIVNVNSGSGLTIDNPTKAHYTFDYWYLSDENTPYVWTTPVTSHLTLNAKYHHTVYTVTFAKENGEDNTVVDVLSGELAAEPSDPIKAHYTFDYWYDTDVNTPFDFNTPIVGLTTLHAKYSPLMFTVNYDNEGVVTPVLIQSGQLLNEPSDPIKEHYDFIHWYTTDELVAYDFSSPVLASFDLHAKFTIRQ